MKEIDPDSRRLFERGLEVRKQMLGDAYVERALREADAFSWPLQEFLTVHAWGASWARGTLDPKLRSMLNLAMLSALNRPHELKIHLRAALGIGIAREEIAEIFIHVGVYCGAPAAVEGFRLAREVFGEVGAEGPAAQAPLPGPERSPNALATDEVARRTTLTTTRKPNGTP